MTTEFIVTDSEEVALESNLIKNHQPHLNVLLKDDKKSTYASPGASHPHHHDADSAPLIASTALRRR